MSTSLPASELPSLGYRVEQMAMRLTARPLFWLLVVGSISGFVIVRSVTTEVPAPPQALFSLPSFELRDQENRTFGSNELKGKFWVANFIFTSCPTMCPLLTERMQEIRYRTRNLGDQVHLVSFTVDPERDTPEVLRKYGEPFGVHPGRWSFLTGSNEAIEAAVVKGFKQPIDPMEQNEGSLFDITHGARFVLVDRNLGVRGLYEATDAGLDEMMRAIKLLIVAEAATPR